MADALHPLSASVHRRIGRTSGLAFGLGLGLCLGAGCDVTAEKIARWKDTERGPVKLREALKKSSVSTELRGQALAVLVEIGMAGEVGTDLKEIPDAERRALVKTAIPLLVKQVPATDTSTKLMRNCKDGLFTVREYAAPEDRPAIDDTLVAWLTVDLTGRMSAGGHSGEKIFTAIGARAGAKLAALLVDDKTSDGSRMEAARLLGVVGDANTREQAGARMVERAKRERNLQEITVQQIGLVGGDHAVAFLTSMAEDGKLTVALRQKALQSLAQRADPASLAAALRLAGDKKAPPKVRDASFELAEKIGAPAVGGLVKLFDDKDDLVRWRAVEAALTAGRDKAVMQVLDAMPVTRTYKRADLKSYLEHDLEMLGPPALPPLREALKSKNWVARVTAVHAIKELGKADDAPRVAALEGDGWKLKGWEGNPSIGSEARAAAEALRSKK